MSFFDAVNHSLTTLATGGFSTKNASIAYWDSPFIHYVVIFFMILAGTNFSLSYCMVTGKYKKAFSNEEFRYYLLFISLFTVIIFLGLLLSSQPDVEKSFRDALFQVVSIMTTTGYVTTNYLTWIPILVILLFSLFFFGGAPDRRAEG
jgi:trk system potassium uptake protein TrkH